MKAPVKYFLCGFFLAFSFFAFVFYLSGEALERGPNLAGAFALSAAVSFLIGLIAASFAAEDAE